MEAKMRNVIKNADYYFREAKKMEQMDYSLIINNLERKFPNAGFFLYGSRVMGVATGDSDLDIFIEMENNFFNSLPRYRAESYVQMVASELQADSRNWTVLKVFDDPSVPVPFIRTFNFPMQIQCDFSFTNGLTVKNTALLAHLFELQPEAAKFTIFIKNWLEVNNIKFKGYFVVLLCVFYLQKENYLPSIETVQENANLCYIDEYEVQFNSSVRHIFYYQVDHLQNFKQGDLIQKFFRFYAGLNYQYCVLSPYYGTIMALSSNEKQWKRPMKLAGPIRQKENHAKEIGEVKLAKFIKLCRRSIGVSYFCDF